MYRYFQSDEFLYSLLKLDSIWSNFSVLLCMHMYEAAYKCDIKIQKYAPSCFSRILIWKTRVDINFHISVFFFASVAVAAMVDANSIIEMRPHAVDGIALHHLRS